MKKYQTPTMEPIRVKDIVTISGGSVICEFNTNNSNNCQGSNETNTQG